MENEQDTRSQLRRDIEEGRARFNPLTDQPYEKTSWASIDLEPYKRGEKIIAPPKFMLRADGKPLIYPSRPHVFYGESESLKSWAAILACKSVIDLGLRATYIDMEGSEASFVERCRLVGVPDAKLGVDLNYIRPTVGLFGDARVDLWLFEMDQFNPSLVVLDGVTELYALQGWDVNRAEDAAKFQGTFAFHRAGVASIAIDHTAKDAGRGQLGSQHKRAGLDGAEYLFESVQARGRGGQSIARVRVKKDRHGYIREWAQDEVGKLIVDSAPDGGSVYLEPPSFKDMFDPKDDAQKRVVEYLTEHPGSTRTDVVKSAGMNKQRVERAFSDLEFLGQIENRGSKNRGSWHVTGSPGE